MFTLIRYSSTKIRMMPPAKKQMISSTMNKIPSIGMDNLSEIFLFCGARERRTFTFISSETSKIYFNNAEEASLNAFTSMVLKRRDNWLLPTMSSKNDTWEECMPPIYKGRSRQIVNYIHYQMTHQMKTAGVVNKIDNENEWAAEEIVYDDELCARMGTLSTILSNTCFYDTPYEAFVCISSDNSPEIVDTYFEIGEHTLIDIGISIRTGNGTLLPLGNVA